MTITKNQILLLKSQGLKNVEIAEKLLIHPTTVGKILKGKILQSRQLGCKTKLTERGFTPIWDAIPDIYELCFKKSYYVSRNYDFKYKDDLLEFLLNYSFTRPIKYIEKLKNMEKPRAYFSICLEKKGNEFCQTLAKRRKIISSFAIEDLDKLISINE